MVSVQADTRFFKGSVRHTAAANINFPKLRVIPGIDHLRTAGFQYLLHRFLHHRYIVRLNVIKPVPVALLRFDLIRHSQKDPHGLVRIHSRTAALLQLNGPDTGSGSLQNPLQALPCVQLVLFLLLDHSIHIPQSENHDILFPDPVHGGKMNLQMPQPIGIILHLIPGCHALRNVLFHSRLIAIHKADIPIHTHLLAVPVYLAFICIEIHLVDAQIIHTERMKHIIAPLLKLADQVPPLQGRYDKIGGSLEHIRCILQGLCRQIVHTVKPDKPFAVIKGNYNKRMNLLPLQVLIRKRIRFPDILQTPNDDMPADAEIPIPVGTHLRRNILQILLFRLHSFCRPLIGIVIPTRLIPLKDISPLSLKRFPQMLQQHLQRLIRRLLQQGHTKPLIDDSLQILNAFHPAVLTTVPVNRHFFTRSSPKLF